MNRDLYCIAAFNFLLPHIKNHQINLCFSGGVGVLPNNKEMQILRDVEQDLSVENIQFIAEKSGVEIDFRNFLTFEQIKKNFTVLDFNNINQDGLEYLSQNWHPDLIISIRFGQIFKNQIIALAKFGIINLHSGILPNYKGIMATFWAMLNREIEIGTTLHFVNDDSIDSGDIISISKNEADYKKPLVANIFKLYPAGLEMIGDVIDKITRDTKIEAVKQNKELGKYFSYPHDKDVEEFLEMGLVLKYRCYPREGGDPEKF